MSPAGWIALLTGVLGVWLTIRESIWCWPFGLVSVTVSIAEFFGQRLYGDMSLQLFYLAAGIYGWINWHRGGTSLKVSRMPRRMQVTLIIATLVAAGIFQALLRVLGGDRPVIDGTLTACSLTATYMMTRKWAGNWLFWVGIDLAYVYLYAVKAMWLFAVLYLFFAAVALWGHFEWRKQLRASAS